MINKIKITNLADAESYSFNKNNKDYNIWVSTVGQEDRKQINRMRKNFQKKNVKFFYQFFTDWSDEDGLEWGHLVQDAPQSQHVQNIISFLKPFAEDDKPHSLGINCFAGPTAKLEVCGILEEDLTDMQKYIDYLLNLK